MNLSDLRRLGFSDSEHIPFTRQYRVKCHSCEALVINGTPTHETGCREATHECHGCFETIPARQRYCSNCM